MKKKSVGELLKRVTEMSAEFDSLVEAGCLPTDEYWVEWRNVCNKIIVGLLEKNYSIESSREEKLSLASKLKADPYNASDKDLRRLQELCDQFSEFDKESKLFLRYVH